MQAFKMHTYLQRHLEDALAQSLAGNPVTAILGPRQCGKSTLDISHVTARKYLDILEHTFMARVLRPLEMNLKKRLVKSPKVYIRDSGILHGLLEIGTLTDLFGHPVFGASWEGWGLEQIANALPAWRAGYYRASSGEEIDLVLERARRRLAFEFKASAAPQLSKGFRGTLAIIKPERTWVVCPLDTIAYSIGENIRVTGIKEVLRDLLLYTRNAA